VNYDALLSPEDRMYSDGDGDHGYVWYNGNDVQVNGVHGVNRVNSRGNGDQYYVPNNDDGGVILSPNTLVFGGNDNDDGGVILSPNTLVFGGNGRSPSAPRIQAPQAVVQPRSQPSFRSVLEGPKHFKYFRTTKAKEEFRCRRQWLGSWLRQWLKP